MAYEYYARFDNVFTGPGVVKDGCIAALPRQQTIEELDANIMVCTSKQMIEKIAEYDEREIDELILSSHLGQSAGETSEMMERFATEVMPAFQ